MTAKRYIYPAIILLAVVLLLSGERFVSSDRFCASCHSMSFSYREYKTTKHFVSPTGVRAGCSDCHLGKGPSKVVSIMRLVPSMLKEFTDPVRDEEGWDARRKRLAERAIRDIGSDRERCRGCHDPSLIRHASDRGRMEHKRGKGAGLHCIVCHRNLAHKEVEG